MATLILRKTYSAMMEEMEALDKRKRETSEKIREAASHGDLKENAEYHGQREEQGRIAAKIGQLKNKLSQCEIVNKEDMPKGVVTFGSTVTIKDLDLDDEETYEFVGPGEEDYDGPVMKILTTSPIATALMGKKVGDKVEIELPRTTMEAEIVKIVDHGE